MKTILGRCVNEAGRSVDPMLTGAAGDRAAQRYDVLEAEELVGGKPKATVPDPEELVGGKPKATVPVGRKTRPRVDPYTI